MGGAFFPCAFYTSPLSPQPFLVHVHINPTQNAFTSTSLLPYLITLHISLLCTLHCTSTCTCILLSVFEQILGSSNGTVYRPDLTPDTEFVCNSYTSTVYVPLAILWNVYFPVYLHVHVYMCTKQNMGTGCMYMYMISTMFFHAYM